MSIDYRSWFDADAPITKENAIKLITRALDLGIKLKKDYAEGMLTRDQAVDEILKESNYCSIHGRIEEVGLTFVGRARLRINVIGYTYYWKKQFYYWYGIDHIRALRLLLDITQAFIITNFFIYSDLEMLKYLIELNNPNNSDSN